MRSKAISETWAISELALQNILEGTGHENETSKAIAINPAGDDIQNTIVRDGVAIISIIGPLFRYANLFTQMSRASSYEAIIKSFTAAKENQEVKAIILNIDSPGGEVNGCSELANMIYEARGIKPIIAYASGEAASGAYWIASSADKIVISETSGLGSIGVVGVYRSNKGESRNIEIISSQSPYKRLDAENEEDRAKLQARIDAMAEVFVKTVARNRGFTEQDVVKHFGGGDILIGKYAIEAGLADGLGSLEKLIAGLSTYNSKDNFLLTNKKEEKMNIETQNQPDAIESTVQERKRIAEILSAEAALGREELARYLAFETNLEVEAALAMLAKAPKAEKLKSSFEQVMQAIGNPKILPAEAREEEDFNAIAKRVANYKL